MTAPKAIRLYPAIDVREGRVVRLAQGDYARETRYPADPLAQAMAYADAGVDALHLVDLDAAREGGYTLLPLLRAIAEDGRLQVQTGGGVRGDDDVLRILDAGAARVVVGSLAVKETARVAGWLQQFGAERIVVALDTRCDDDGVWRLCCRRGPDPRSGRFSGVVRMVLKASNQPSARFRRTSAPAIA